MIKDCGHYNLFFEFVEAYSPSGFRGIDRQDPLILSLEELLKENKQFLGAFDMLNMKTMFASNGTSEMLGVKPDDITSYHFKEATHPDDLKRHELGLAKMFKISHDLFTEKKGERMISTNFRFRNPSGYYTNQLVQCYFFYSPAPNNTVYMIGVNTDITWYKKKKNGFHFYHRK